VEAVDDADQKAFSMFCIDDVRTVSLPPGHSQPLEPLPPFDERAALRLENEHYRVEVSRANGAITRILDKTGNLELIREPRLAGNFKFTLPLPGQEPWETIEANYLVGRDQALTAHDLQGPMLTLRWQRLKSRSGAPYDVATTMGIALEKEAIRFTLRIENHTRYPLGEVFFPVLGGVTGLGHRSRELKSTKLVRPAGTGITTADIFFLYPNLSGLGDQGPEQFSVYPKDLAEPWLEFFSPRPRRSVYLGAHDRDDRSLVLHLELLPGIAETPRWDGNWPRREELQGQPAGVLLSFVHFAQHPAGKTYEAAPVVLQAHDGDWHAGQPIYRRWKDDR
jgi:hypothetical protein